MKAMILNKISSLKTNRQPLALVAIYPFPR